MPLGDPRVRMSQLIGDHAHGDTLHGKRRCICVPENVERGCQLDLRSNGSRFQRSLLMGSTPNFAIISGEIGSLPLRPIVSAANTC